MAWTWTIWTLITFGGRSAVAVFLCAFSFFVLLKLPASSVRRHQNTRTENVGSTAQILNKSRMIKHAFYKREGPTTSSDFVSEAHQYIQASLAMLAKPWKCYLIIISCKATK